MRIAVNTRFLLQGKLEGIGRFTEESLSRMVRSHPEHEFFFFFDRPYDPRFVFADNVKAFVLRPPARHPVLFFLWFEFAVHQKLRQLNADVFLSTDGFMSLRSKVPTLIVVHDISFRHFPEFVPFAARKYYDFFTPRFLDKAAGIATVSEYSKKDIMAEFGVAAEKIGVVYNGVNKEFQVLLDSEIEAVRKEYSEGLPYFFYIGSVHPRKNVARLIRAFTLFRKQSNRPLKLLLGGRMAWQTSEVEEAYLESAFQDDIQFLGRLSQEKLVKLTASAYALTYVSVLEGFGIPILEAMKCGVPVITANVTSMPEVAGDAAILVDPFSVDDIAAGMLKLVNEEGLRHRCKSAGKVRAEAFSWEQTAEKLWQLLLDVSKRDA